MMQGFTECGHVKAERETDLIADMQGKEQH